MSGIEIAGVCERDIDLFLLEEFQASPNFLDWFWTAAFPGEDCPGSCMSAKRSVTYAGGESDLELLLEGKNKERTLLMVENKVRAGLQPEQAQRYGQRGKDYIALLRCSKVVNVLVAPERYFGVKRESKGFDSVVSYEDILRWIREAPGLGLRKQYKIALLSSAIEKGIHGWQLVEDAPNSNFWLNYWQLAEAEVPVLRMKKPDKKPSRSGFIRFYPLEMPERVQLFHKFNRGHVDILFPGLGGLENEVRSALRPLLPELNNAEVVSAARSAAIRVEVPKLSAARGLKDQLANARIGLEAARHALAWLLKHRAAIEPLLSELATKTSTAHASPTRGKLTA